MRSLARTMRRVDQIAAELADVLDERAVPCDDVVPEMPRRKFVADHDRAAAHQHRAGRHDAADAVIERQAVIHAVAWAGVHEAGEPKAPLQQPPVAHTGGLRQSGRAGGIDQERAIRDRHRAAFGRAQPLARELFDRVIDALKLVAAVRPNLRVAHELRRCAPELLAQFGGDDDVCRRDDVDAMGERDAAQLGVDQRNDDADAGEAEPDRQIFGPVRHHQADDLALGELLLSAQRAKRLARAAS